MSFTGEDSPSGLSEFVILIALKFLGPTENGKLMLNIYICIAQERASPASSGHHFVFQCYDHFQANDGFDCSLSELKQKNKPVEPSSLNKSRCCRRFGWMTHKPGHVMNFLHDGRQLLVVKGRYAAKNSEEILLPYQQVGVLCETLHVVFLNEYVICFGSESQYTIL
uniref:Uncharacterized protein n=2 Tax=Brassica campestris TaxID=3711 RepID=M4DLW3_BRACM